MKNLLTSIFLLITTLTFSQTYNYKPLWKKGTVKKIITTYSEKEYENDRLQSDTSYSIESTIKVINEDQLNYTIEITYQNIAYRKALELYETFGEELNQYRDLKLVYTIHKTTAKADLKNWKEVQTYMNESIDQITSLITKKVPEMAAFANLIFNPIKDMYKSKENIEASMEDEIGFILIPFNKNYKIGDTISVTESTDNPFNPKQKISATQKLVLKKVDKTKMESVIEENVELDLKEFKEMMKAMLMQMAKSFEVEDSISTEKMKELDDFTMDISQIQVITFNYQTTWVTKSVKTSKVTSTDPQKGKRDKIVTTTTILQ